MPENTATAPLAPMDPDDVSTAFAYIRAVQAHDTDTACAIAQQTEPELRTVLLDVAERIITPVTAPDGDNEPGRDPFVTEALGRMLLDILRVEDGICPANSPGIARAVIRFTQDILTEDHQDVAHVLAQLENADTAQALRAPSGTRPARVTGK